MIDSNDWHDLTRDFIAVKKQFFPNIVAAKSSMARLDSPGDQGLGREALDLLYKS